MTEKNKPAPGSEIKLADLAKNYEGLTAVVDKVSSTITNFKGPHWRLKFLTVVTLFHGGLVVLMGAFRAPAYAFWFALGPWAVVAVAILFGNFENRRKNSS